MPSHTNPHATDGFIQHLTDDAFLVIKAEGEDATWGLPCCSNKSIQCHRPPLPEELRGAMALSDLFNMCDELNKVFAETVFPESPLMYILPVPFCCIGQLMSYQRRNGVEQVLSQYNTQIASKGFQFVSIGQKNNFTGVIAKLISLPGFNHPPRARAGSHAAAAERKTTVVTLVNGKLHYGPIDEVEKTATASIAGSGNNTATSQQHQECHHDHTSHPVYQEIPLAYRTDIIPEDGFVASQLAESHLQPKLQRD